MIRDPDHLQAKKIEKFELYSIVSSKLMLMFLRQVISKKSKNFLGILDLEKKSRMRIRIRVRIRILVIWIRGSGSV